MSELSGTTENKFSQKQKLAAIEAMVLSLVTGAKSVLLYKPGHVMITQVAERTHKNLLAAVGMEPTLTLDLKAKQILYGETALTETKETVIFASALHNLGIGQILITSRVTIDGIIDIFKVLNLKTDEKTTLSDLQKALQATRIDGMQLVFILSFVVTGEEDIKSQTPGVLSEEQIQAYLSATNLTDYLYLLFKQNEPLVGKEVDVINELFDGVLNRDIPMEKFETEMLWTFYDPRIKARFEELAKDLRRPPVSSVGGKAKPRWERVPLLNHLAFLLESDKTFINNHKTHEKPEATRQALELSRRVIESPAGPQQPKYGAMAYLRLLSELVYESDLPAILREFDYWLILLAGEKAATLPQFQAQVREKIVNPTLAAAYVLHLAKLEKDGPDWKKLEAFALFLGEGIIPLLLEELRGVQDKDHRAKLCALMVVISPKLALKPLQDALADIDWFLVVNVAAILRDIGAPESFPLMIPLISHRHQKVRETIFRILARFGSPEAADGMADFIVKTDNMDEAKLAVTTLSQIQAPDIDKRLVAIHKKLSSDNMTALASYEVRVQILSVLGRVQVSPPTLEYLESMTQRSWHEMFTELFGAVNRMRLAARTSLEQARKEIKTHGAKS